MEKQRISLFRRKNKWGLTALTVFLSPLLLLALLFPQTLSLVPVVALLLLGYVGPVSCSMLCGMFIALCLSLFGGMAAVVAAGLLVPVVIAASMTTWNDVPFKKAACIIWATAFISDMAIVGILTVQMHTDLVSGISAMMGKMFSAYPVFGDMMLSLMGQAGVIDIPAAGLDAAARSEILSEIVGALDMTLRLEIPSQIATGSFATGFIGQLLLRSGLRSRGEKTDLPPVRTWRMPKGWGLVLGVTVAVLWGMSYMMPETFTTMFYTFAGLAQKIFALQGVAAMDWVLHRHGKGKKLRTVVGALGFFAMSTAACVVGIGDQLLDISKRREDLGDKAQEDEKGFFDRF